MGKRQKLKGALLGYAIGDALGKGTEFMELPEVKMRYPYGLRRYDEIYQDAHRSQWAPGEWTNDTVVMLNMARAIVKDHGSLLVKHQARVLLDWYNSQPVDVVSNMRWVLSHPGYAEHPLEVAAEVWDNMHHREASNEALGRSMLAAFAPGDPEVNARTTNQLTHSDTRCEGTAAILGRVAHDLLHHNTITPKATVMELAEKIDDRIVPYVKVAYSGELADFELDDPETQAYTRKAMGCALWSLHHCKDAEEALYMLTDAGGDADTNAALGVALCALRDDGELHFPSHLIEGLEGHEQVLAVADELARVWGME